MSSTNRQDIEELDAEWKDLIVTARNLGLSLEDVREFLRNPLNPAQQVHSSTNKEQTYIPVICLGTAET